jgi:hypothetical protein
MNVTSDLGRKMRCCIVSLVLIFGLLASTAFGDTPFHLRGQASDWPKTSFVGRDDAGDAPSPELDLCNLFFVEEGGALHFRFTTVAPSSPQASYSLEIRQKGTQRSDMLTGQSPGIQSHQSGCMIEVAAPEPAGFAGVERITVRLYDPQGKLADELVSDGHPRGTTGNAAFVHHGNQGLTWTNVFRGNDDNSGFDEILALHQGRGVPANFHLSGTLITAAEWHDRGFNDWLRQGIAEGWICMVTSAYGQHIMPFVQHVMNEWAVNTEDALIYSKYNNFEAKVAWIPERVWCSQGHYPDNGIPDPPWHGDPWLGDNWQQHGITAILLDDWPHLSGYSNRKIHWMQNGSGVTLRVIPIDGSFTGNCLGNSGAAIAQIQGTGQYGIAIYGTDWEAAAALSDWCDQGCLQNYSAVVNWCADNYPAVDVWRLDAALDNPDFNGVSAELGLGTYGSIGGTDGYGGSNNSWYTDWYATGSHSDHHSPQWTYGQVWWDAYNTLNAAPDNNIRETGKYVLMTNLHETGWHDYMGGPISGWEHRYSSHIKNANVYAEAAHWANGEYGITTNAFFSDVDHDGCQELCIHNDRVFAVFDSIGGRAIWVFAKGPNGNFSIVGNCNVYWTDTEGDWDEPGSNNHQAALADVSPHYRDYPYNMFIDAVTDSTAEIRMTYNELTKRVLIKTGEPYLDCRYDVGFEDCYLRSGFSPDLRDLIWNADMTRIYDPQVAYVGYRNPHTGATGLYVIGNGQANWNSGGVFTATLLGGDELHGYRQFGFLLYAGETTAPVGEEIVEIEALATQNLDFYSPWVVSPAIYVDSARVQMRLSEAVALPGAEVPGNYTFSGFGTTYTVLNAQRQNDWSKVVLTVSPNFVGGQSGTITASNLYDLNGNLIDPAYDQAALSIPTGFTPHTIVIDGTFDFDRTNEFLTAVGAESLFFTWDYQALYVAVKDKDLATGDLFVSLDTNPGTTSGATQDSWYRVNYTGTFRPEYEIAIEGGPNNMQNNYWDGSAWVYRQYGQHDGTSYNGWSGNPLTEMRIPWADIGNPTSLALAVHITQEDNLITTTVWPQYGNTPGDNITIYNFYRLYQPYIFGPMPLGGYAPKDTPYRELPSNVNDLVIHVQGSNLILTWSASDNADSYNIYRASDPFGIFSLLQSTSDTTYTDVGAAAASKYFYRVRAAN